MSSRMSLGSRLCALLASVSLAGGLQAAPALRILPLGDSITQGTGDTAGGGYRGPLWTLLKNAGYNADFVGSQTDTSCTLAGFDKNHEGHGGWRVDETYGGDVRVSASATTRSRTAATGRSSRTRTSSRCVACTSSSARPTRAR